ncbi:MAG TPA: hypothetical protein VK636_07910 [Gemmatimonadaceae bacterium]|nr:hypothetical protein [Gemmatimonadaceae bacterium]
MTPAYVKQKAAAAYLGVSVRYFRDCVDVRPKELPGTRTRPMLVWAIADLDAWVARVSDPKSRARKAS